MKQFIGLNKHWMLQIMTFDTMRLYNLGLIYEKKGDWYTAISYYKDAIELNPDYAQAKSSLTRLTSLLN